MDDDCNMMAENSKEANLTERQAVPTTDPVTDNTTAQSKKREAIEMIILCIALLPIVFLASLDTSILRRCSVLII